jgi:hypothetical protein
VGTRVLIVLDEFDRCESPEFQRNIAEFLKNLSDRSVRVQLVIAGVAANLRDLMDQGPKMQRNILALAIPKMSDQEIGELVDNGQEASGLTFDGGAKQSIVSIANGSPYLASLLSQHAGLSAIERESLTVTVDDTLTALAEALSELEGRMTRRAQIKIEAALRDGSGWVLGQLAGVAQHCGGEFTAEDVGVAKGGVSGMRIQSFVDALAEEGVLFSLRQDEFGSRYRFVEETVPAYLWLKAAQTRSVMADAAAPVVAAAPRAAAEF